MVYISAIRKLINPVGETTMNMQPWMNVVAGLELLTALQIERERSVPMMARGYDSDALCALQRKQASRGILGAEIVKSIYGYSVRYDSGLQNWGLLASAKARQIDGSYDAALKWVTEWVAQSPTTRYAWTREKVE